MSQQVEQAANGCRVTLAIVEVEQKSNLVKKEVFVLLTYVMSYRKFDGEAMHLHKKDVPQGVSCTFIADVHGAEMFTSDLGSDCVIASGIIGPSISEVGGTSSGEKKTGGGGVKELHATQINTISYPRVLPLALDVILDKYYAGVIIK